MIFGYPAPAFRSEKFGSSGSLLSKWIKLVKHQWSFKKFTFLRPWFRDQEWLRKVSKDGEIVMITLLIAPKTEFTHFWFQ